jgi:hypothetical protein
MSLRNRSRWGCTLISMKQEARGVQATTTACATSPGCTRSLGLAFLREEKKHTHTPHIFNHINIAAAPLYTPHPQIHPLFAGHMWNSHDGTVTARSFHIKSDIACCAACCALRDTALPLPSDTRTHACTPCPNSSPACATGITLNTTTTTTTTIIIIIQRRSTMRNQDQHDAA